MSGSINDPAAPPSARQPLLRVLYNGKVVPGALEASWTTHNRYASDDWSATFATSADQRFGQGWWDGLQVPIELDIQVGLLVNGAVVWTSLGIGYVDHLSLNPDDGTAEVSGRDLSALLLEAKTAEAFQNQTSSQIVALIAARHGLTADVTATGNIPNPTTTTTSTTLVGHDVQLPAPGDRKDKDTFAGRVFTTDVTTRTTQATQSSTTNEWELLVALAREDGFDLYVTGRTLSYHPPTDPGSPAYVLRYKSRTGNAATPVSNAISLRMSHKLVLKKPLEVRVMSFHSRVGKGTTAYALSPGAVKGSTENQVYKFRFPNLTPAQAQNRANNYLTEIAKQERVINWSEPANMLITPRSIVRLEGTETGFDQTYFADTITRTISFDRGFAMTCSAKNQSPQVTEAAQ